MLQEVDLRHRDQGQALQRATADLQTALAPGKQDTKGEDRSGARNGQKNAFIETSTLFKHMLSYEVS